MSKKTCRHKYSHAAYSKKGSSQCPLHTNWEIVSHVCRLCNVTGRSCQNIDERSKNDCGDYTQDNIHGNVKKNNVNNTSRIDLHSQRSINSQNLASGDYNEANKVQNFFRNNHAITKNNYEKSSTSVVQGPNTDTTIEYLNANYNDGISTTNSSLCSLIKNNLLNTGKTEFEHDLQDTKTIRRPVFCPVSSCAKLVAIDSIMRHFYFDHSRVPRITLITGEPHDIFVKSVISSETECIAMLLMKILGRPSQISQNSDCVSYVNSLNYNNKLLLLMAVRLKISAVKLSKRDDPKHVLKRNSYSQTNKMDFNKYIEINNNRAEVYQTDCKLNISKPERYENDDIVLIWLCKLDAEEKTYTIIMTREDHKLSYGYTGDAIHIKEKQDPLSIYESPECLIVRGKAINKLLNKDNNIKLVVNCLD